MEKIWCVGVCATCEGGVGHVLALVVQTVQYEEAMEAPAVDITERHSSD